MSLPEPLLQPPPHMLSTGAGRMNPQATRIALEGLGAKLAGALAHKLEQLEPSLEVWWSPHTWHGDYRESSRWRATSAVVFDLDYHGGDGAHSAPSDRVSIALLKAARAGKLPGNVFHVTPRGARLVAILVNPITDPELLSAAVEGACVEVHRALEELGLHAHRCERGKWRDGYAIDEGAAYDRARFFYAPRASVAGVHRDAEVLIIGRELMMPTRAAQVSARPPLARPFGIVRSALRSTEREDATSKWNRDHAQDWGAPGSGRCPACKHNDCFGRLPHIPGKWCCFSDNHDSDSGGVGIRSKDGRWIGDALDLEAHARQCSPSDVLRQDGYLLAPRPDESLGRQSATGSGASPASNREKTPNPTDVGNADRFARMHEGTAVYCAEWKCWFVWDDRRWARDRDGKVQQLAKAVPRTILEEALHLEDDQRAKLARHALQSENYRRILGMLDLARSDPRIAALPERFDGKATRYLLNVQNGTLDLRTGELLEAQRKHHITRLAPVTFDPAAKCPSWDAFLARVLPDPEVRAFLQRHAGSALTGDADDQVFILLLGLGANGKSTYIKVLMQLLGEYARWAAFDTLLEAGRRADRRGAPRPDLMALRGARLVAAIEAGEGRALDEATMKMLTGGDGVSARGLYQDQADWMPEFKLILSVNHEPLIKSTDSASWRRPLEVPFDVTIPPDEQEPDLHLRLCEPNELSGILNWAIAGCLAWQKNRPPRLAPPDAVIAATRAYQRDQDVLSPFINARCELRPEAVTSAADLWKAYKEWCEEERETPMSRRMFGSKLRGKGLKSTTLGHQKTRAWNGIRLLLALP
jgi:P4 family phage/plasmid primase-like protien